MPEVASDGTVRVEATEAAQGARGARGARAAKAGLSSPFPPQFGAQLQVATQRQQVEGQREAKKTQEEPAAVPFARPGRGPATAAALAHPLPRRSCGQGFPSFYLGVAHGLRRHPLGGPRAAAFASVVHDP